MSDENDHSEGETETEGVEGQKFSEGPVASSFDIHEFFTKERILLFIFAIEIFVSTILLLEIAKLNFGSRYASGIDIKSLGMLVSRASEFKDESTKSMTGISSSLHGSVGVLNSQLPRLIQREINRVRPEKNNR